jgi:hypothetical protein
VDDAPVVLIVSVAVAGADPAIDADGSIVHEGAFFAPEGLAVTAQASDTAPVKPPLGVMVMVEVDEPPALIVVSGLLLMAKDGFGAGAD